MPLLASTIKGPILVTGIPRSGTNFVGRMLDASGECVLINEPLNLHVKPGRPTGLLRARVEQFYQYICQDNESEYLPAFRDLVRLRDHPVAELLERPRDADLVVWYWFNFLRGRLQRRRALIRDPYACLSAQWFAERLRCRVVFLVRHPLAVVSSHKRLGWKQRIHWLLDQPLLARDRLGPFRAELEEIAAFPEDIVWGASLLWRIVNGPAWELQKHSAAVTVVRQEDLSRNPREEFEKLYRTLGLELSDRVRSAISYSTAPDNPHEGDVDNAHEVRLDSRATLTTWRDRLSDEEVERIRALTSDIAPLYYPDERDWRADVVQSPS
jgi:hypothetical protein